MEAWTLTKKEEQALLIFEREIFTRIFIHSLVFSLRGRAGRNQSPVM